MKSKIGARGWRFAKALFQAIIDDHVLTGAAALSYYLLFSLFPGLIFLLTLLPYLPVENLHQTVMGFLSQALPIDASRAVESVVAEVTLHKRGGLLSFGILLTLWSASSAVSAIMEEVNITFGIVDRRAYWRGKLIAIALSIYLAVIFILSGILLVGGAWLQNWLNTSGAVHLGLSDGFHELWQAGLAGVFIGFKWCVLTLLVLSAFAVTLHFGLDRSQFRAPLRFRLFSPGSVSGVALLFLASVGFRTYVAKISNYTSSYGSLGAVIILLFWLYLAGLVLLLGSEINALFWRKHESWLAPEHLSEADQLQAQARRLLGEAEKLRAKSERLRAVADNFDAAAVAAESAEVGRGVGGGKPSPERAETAIRSSGWDADSRTPSTSRWPNS